MEKIKRMVGLMAVFALLLFFSGCFGMVPIPVEAPVAAVGIDYTEIYYDGNLYSYWVWDQTGAWVFYQSAFLPPAYIGRTVIAAIIRGVIRVANTVEFIDLVEAGITQA